MYVLRQLISIKGCKARRDKDLTARAFNATFSKLNIRDSHFHNPMVSPSYCHHDNFAFFLLSNVLWVDVDT